jgi:hypothetical protein
MAFKGRKYDGEASAMGENDSRKASTMKVKRQRQGRALQDNTMQGRT